MTQLSLAKDKIQILLLEGIHENAVEGFRVAGYSNVEHLKTALDRDELRSRLADAHMVGIRSRSRLTAEALESAHRLFCVGCFCVRTHEERFTR